MRNTETDPDFENLLEYLKRSRGFDFSGYKRASLMRRVNKRMQSAGINSYPEYLDYLEVHPDEFKLLFDTILISVTSFFRDPASWEYLRTEVIPKLMFGKRDTDPIRIWSAGCATGEEAFTIAMIFAEALGIDQFRERVKIYASDMDENALSQARQSTYPEGDVASIPPALLEKYFEKPNGRYTFRKDLRRSIIFGRHDLIQDAPISRLDLLVCRNILMYFNAETQARILSRFHFALNDIGFLFLGKAEMLFAHGNLFVPVDLKRRVFSKIAQGNLGDQLMVMSQPQKNNASDHVARNGQLREYAFDANPIAQLILDVNGEVSLINERARVLLNLNHNDLNRPLRNLTLGNWSTQIKQQVEEVLLDGKPTIITDIEWLVRGNESLTLEAQISPLAANGEGIMGVSITLLDVTAQKHMQEEIEHTNQELETAYEELQSTNEELETTNEELQSTIEELETINEEMLSTNEELETINEEMQSTNEEIQTVNEELRQRTEELNQANTFMASILASLRGGVVVVDKELQVQVWSRKAEDLWGLRSTEAQAKNFLNLDIGLPVAQLKKPIWDCLSGESDIQEINLEAINRRGKSIRIRVTCTPLLNAQDQAINGVILLMEEGE